MHPLIAFAKKYPNEGYAANLCRKFRELFFTGEQPKEKFDFYIALGLVTDGWRLFKDGNDITTLPVSQFVKLLETTTFNKIAYDSITNVSKTIN